MYVLYKKCFEPERSSHQTASRKGSRKYAEGLRKTIFSLNIDIMSMDNPISTKTKGFFVQVKMCPSTLGLAFRRLAGKYKTFKSKTPKTSCHK